jgi:hypothetical protein
VAAVSTGKVYGDSDPPLTYVIQGQGGGLMFSDTPATVFSGNVARAMGENVGIYPITQGTLTLVSTNYTLQNFNPGEFTITARPIRVAAVSAGKVYGDMDPPLTYVIQGQGGGLVLGDTAGSVFSGNVARAMGENVGIYPITQGTLTLVSTNYTLQNFNPGEFTITARPIRVAAVSTGKVYGDSDPPLTYVIQGQGGGLMFSDAPATVFSGNVARAMGENVGIYPITQGTLTLVSTNYTLQNFNPGEFTITARPIRVAAVSTSKIYGNSDPPLTYVIQGQGGGLMFSDTPGSVFTGNVARAMGENVGVYPITQGTLTLVSTNYTLLNFNPGQLAITPRALTVTAVNRVKTFGTTYNFDASAPSPDFAVVGLIGSDSVTSITITSAGAPAAAPVGPYSIVPSAALGAGLGNYTIAYVNGTMTVTVPANFPPVAHDKEVSIVVRSKPFHHDDDDDDWDDHHKYDWRKFDGHGHHDYHDHYGGRWDRDDDERDDDDDDREWERFADIFRGLRITLSATDVDNRRLRFRIVDGPDHGILSRVRKVRCVPNGSGGGSCTAQVIYIPAPHYLGPDVFTYVANDGTQDSNVATVAVNLVPPFTTYSQGGWGSKPWGGNPGRFLSDNFAAVYPAGVTIGDVKKLKFTGASAISNFLPAGGKAAALPSSAPALATNPNSSKAGVLAGHVLALQLNVDFSNAGKTRPGLAGQKIDRGKLRNKNVTVAQLLSLANTVLGGNTGALSNVLGTGVNLTISELSDILENVNENYEGGKKDEGYLTLS